jgi:hypothetical protein
LALPSLEATGSRLDAINQAATPIAAMAPAFTSQRKGKSTGAFIATEAAIIPRTATTVRNHCSPGETIFGSDMCSPKRERREVRIYAVIETEDDVLQVVWKDWSELVIPQP